MIVDNSRPVTPENQMASITHSGPSMSRALAMTADEDVAYSPEALQRINYAAHRLESDDESEHSDFEEEPEDKENSLPPIPAPLPLPAAGYRPSPLSLPADLPFVGGPGALTPPPTNPTREETPEDINPFVEHDQAAEITDRVRRLAPPKRNEERNEAAELAEGRRKRARTHGAAE